MTQHQTAPVRERPILFSAPMVRALLDGRKTQTRRIVKTLGVEEACAVHNANMGGPGRGLWWDLWFPGTDKINRFRCPYGVPGDALWVRESFATINRGSRANPRLEPMYAADWVGFDKPDRDWNWKPPAHMPRWASRITLRITDVRVERLNDISEADAIAVGLYRSLPTDDDREWLHDWTLDRTGAPPTEVEIAQFSEGVWMVPGVPRGWDMTTAERRRDQWAPTPLFGYQQLWEHINGEQSWAKNPWTWAISFERITTGAEVAK